MKALLLCDAVVIEAQKNNNNEIETQAHQLLGVLYRRMDQTDKSISEYEKAIAISNNDAAKVEAQISLGDIYLKIVSTKGGRDLSPNGKLHF